MLRLNSRDSARYCTQIRASVKPLVTFFQGKDIGGTANSQRKGRPLGAYEMAAAPGPVGPWRAAGASIMLESRPPSGSLRRAGLTQLVECQLPKLDVAGSNPVLRSMFPS